MGVELVKAAQAYVLPHLGKDDRARTIIQVMATTALDTDTDPLYFAGSDPLARALGFGHICGDPATCGRAACDRSGRFAVGRALDHLVRLGAIDQLRGDRSHNRRWLLKRADWPHIAARPITHEVTPASRHEVTPVQQRGDTGATAR